MLGGIAAIGPYMNHYQYYSPLRTSRVSQAMQVQAAQRAGAAASAGRISVSGRASSPGTPVEPISPVSAVNANGTNGISQMIPFLRKGMDPAEFAVRMRIQYSDGSSFGKNLKGMTGAEDVQKASEEGECQTCEKRKYQDGSDDAGVSYQTPTHIAPEQAASAVLGHEMEHVVREQAKAEREGRKVVSQSVTVHTAICPECGKPYVSGGTTKTTTAESPGIEMPVPEQENNSK